MARVAIKPREPLYLDFADGVTKVAVFDMRALFIFTDEFGDMEDVAREEANTLPYEYGAKILYCGLKAVDKRVTLDEARAIVYAGGEDLMIQVTNHMVDNFMVNASETDKKKFLDTMEAYLEEQLNALK